jgi:hypothetical protein
MARKIRVQSKKSRTESKERSHSKGSGMKGNGQEEKAGQWGCEVGSFYAFFHSSGKCHANPVDPVGLAILLNFRHFSSF